MTIEDIRGAVARGWCADKNRHKEMDGDLAEAISQEIVLLLMSCWTTKVTSEEAARAPQTEQGVTKK